MIFRGLSTISLAHVVILSITSPLAGCPKCSSPTEKKGVIISHLYWPPDTGFYSFLGSSSEFYLFLRVSVARCHLFLSKLLQPLNPASALRSTDQLLLETPRSRLKSRGDGAFSVMVHNLLKSPPFHDT